MTSIRIERKPNHYDLAIVGHAGYEEEGKDIVCAAISILTYVLGNEIETHTDLYRNRQIELQSGLAMVHVEYMDGERANTVFDLIESGLEMIEENYPDYVKIEKF